MFVSDEVAQQKNLFANPSSVPSVQLAVPAPVASQPLHSPAANGLSANTASLFQHFTESAAHPESSVPLKGASGADKKEEMTGIGSSVAIGRFVAAARHVETHWAQLKPPERADKLGTAANDELKAIGVPEVPAQLEELGGDAGRFHFKTWTLGIDKTPFAQPSITQADAAEIADTIYHETRHAEQFHRAARVLGGQKRNAEQIAKQLGIPLKVALDARGKALDPSKPEGIEAQLFHDSICGKDHQYRTDVLNEFRKKSDAQDKAQSDYEELAAKPGASSAEIAQAKQAMEKAEKEYDDADGRYRGLPEEADAWKIGGAVTSAYLSGT